MNEGRITGIVALVLRDGKPVYERAVGWLDKEAGRKMTMDAEFRIASQSKALTSVAILQLMEEGKLTVNERAGKYIPTFEQTRVLTRAENSTATSIVAAKRPITIRDLLTHTAGINYGQQPEFAPLYEPKGLGPAAGFGWYFADKDEPICTTMETLGTLPFESQPGERYVYGYNTDILGCIVEKASGVPLDEYIRSHITGPLGMKDTYFYLPPEKKRPPRGGLRQRQGRQGRAPARRRARPGPLRRRTAHELLGRRGPRLHGARLRHVPRGAAQWRRARQDAHPLAARRAAHDHQPDRAISRIRAASGSGTASRRTTSMARAAWSPWARGAGAAPTAPTTASTRPSA